MVKGHVCWTPKSNWLLGTEIGMDLFEFGNAAVSEQISRAVQVNTRLGTTAAFC
jgi:hypothetical protein